MRERPMYTDMGRGGAWTNSMRAAGNMGAKAVRTCKRLGGSELVGVAPFGPHCGRRLAEAEDPTSTRNGQTQAS